MTAKSSTFYSDQVMGEYGRTPPVIHRKQATMVRPLPASETTRRLLDIGSGAGVGAQLLAHTIGIDHVTCIDISVQALSEVVTKGFSPLIASAEGPMLPFPNEAFDVVVIDEVLEHLVDTDSVMSEIHRVLKSRGQLVLSTPNLASWFNRIALVVGFQPAYSEVSFRKVYGRPGSGIVGHLRLFTRRALVEFVADAGFDNVRVKGVPFPELPLVAQPIDRLISRSSSLAGGLVVVADKAASH